MKCELELEESPNDSFDVSVLLLFEPGTGIQCPPRSAARESDCLAVPNLHAVWVALARCDALGRCTLDLLLLLLKPNMSLRKRKTEFY